MDMHKLSAQTLQDSQRLDSPHGTSNSSIVLSNQSST